ncbi:hypothetical protein DFQ27_002049 [Actinomortierella ambigua]|uniref:NADH-ubiquinone oxidoreductase 12 kDa subunit n=1 Tax=Actinomortierella ambigua TaxID=1343610 RepID=A0A9P6U7T3_9FUNG|nr:hypothetical protein DFQ26_008653 [Actinomortierella ambigua]KAG0262891.1 hypothetical protein DFQ27_002049 [Actinomortierella ambigua]
MTTTADSWEYPAQRKFDNVVPLSEVDPNDKAAVLRSRALAVRESWVKAMEGRIVQEQLKKCYRHEGVNHYEKCRHLAELYMTSLREKRVEGWRKIEKESH